MLNLQFNDNLIEGSEWHFMPIRITTGETTIPDAKVSNYFKPSIK
jgi:hypothetical protein